MVGKGQEMWSKDSTLACRDRKPEYLDGRKTTEHTLNAYV